MLSVFIVGGEFYDEGSDLFFTVKPQTLQLEHSLVSLTKWEEKWEKPFLDGKRKTIEETIDYIHCMTITQNVDPKVYDILTDDVIDAVNKYIERPMTATTITKRGAKRGLPEIITAEVIYYWMVALQIPFECKKWHLNKLMMLIEVCNIRSSPQKKMSKKETYAHNRAICAANRKRFASRG